MKRLWIILSFVVVAVGLLIPARIRQDRGWIDSISGSQMSQTVWVFGAKSTPVLSELLLAARYRKLGLQWNPDWKSVRGTSINVLGRAVGSAHGLAPEIYSLAVHPDLQQSYLAAASDEEVCEFFRIMSSGTEQEKKAAVAAAQDRVLGKAGTTQPADKESV